MTRTALLNNMISAGILALVMFALSCKKQPVNNTPTATTASFLDTTKYNIVWSDEFNGTSVDATKWNFETGSPNVNNEDEYYKAENATVANGNLVITAKKETNGNLLYTSARMNTLNKVNVQYGMVEARIKLPLASGLWPAFWMLGNNINTVSWPDCGEIDIMEQVNTNNTIYGTMHWNGGAGHVHYGLTTIITNPGDYHVYAITWDKKSINWYVDNNLYVIGDIANNIGNTAAFQNPFFIILNMAVGGDFPGPYIDNSALPAGMYVDWVRVGKLK